MTVPGRVAAARLLCSLGPPDWFVRHATAVADVAAWLARRASTAGHPVDRRLVEAAALLHDVDKLLPPDDPRRALPHGDGSAAWLTAAGAPELADAVRDHPVPRLAEPAAARRVLGAALEVRLVAYADKRAGLRLESMAARFASWRLRYPVVEDGDGWTLATIRAAEAAAATLERRVCDELGIRPRDVRRLRWARRAIVAGSRIEPDRAVRP